MAPCGNLGTPESMWEYTDRHAEPSHLTTYAWITPSLCGTQCALGYRNAVCLDRVLPILCLNSLS